tara:strand:- start:1787 stop:2431 length:645 start_codon:yes stop_codon:yes gene_type:complete
MFAEIACYGQDATFDDILNTIFISSEEGAECVALPSGFMGRVGDFLEHQTFAAVIDFPYGISTTQVRLHEIILAIRQGANLIDLVLNGSYLKEENWKKVEEDLKTCLTVCKNNDVILRPILEYKLFSPKTVLKACEVLEKYHITTVINSTGSIIDDPSDNAIICHSIQKNTTISVISCSNRITPKYFDIFMEMGIEGFRFTSSSIAKNILSNGV